MDIRKYALAAAAFAACAMPMSASAETFAMFFDGNFVDVGEEGAHMLADVQGMGHTVNTFTGTSLGDFQGALAGVHGLILPEMEFGDLASSLDSDTLNLLTDYVMNGGCLIQANYFVSNSAVPNALFGWSLTQTASQPASNLNAANAAGTQFAGGPAVLAGSDSGADAVEGVLTSSLAGGTLSIYEIGDVTTVFAAEVGAGHYVYLGFDWFENPTDATWLDVTERALEYCVVPEPATMAALGLGAAAMLRRRKRG